MNDTLCEHAFQGDCPWCECNRLRAEVAELREALEQIAKKRTSFGYEARTIARAVLAKTAKEGE